MLRTTADRGKLRGRGEALGRVVLLDPAGGAIGEGNTRRGEEYSGAGCPSTRSVDGCRDGRGARAISAMFAESASDDEGRHTTVQDAGIRFADAATRPVPDATCKAIPLVERNSSIADTDSFSGRSTALDAIHASAI